MSIAFVSSAILTSSDGFKHDIKKIQQPEPNDGGLVVRNVDEEKLKARDTTNLTLYEQLQQNKDDKEDDFESQLRESRMPKALDDEEVAFLEEQSAKVFKARQQHIEQEEQDIAEFRAAKLAFDGGNDGDKTAAGSSSSPSTSSTTFSSSSSSSSSPSSSASSSSTTSKRTAVSSQSKVVSIRPRLTLKRKRQQPKDDATAATKDGTGKEATKKRQATSTTEHVNPVLGLIANYASSSDDDE